MSREILKDAHFCTISFIDTYANCKQTARNAHFSTVSYYDPRTNVTVDSHFSRVSTGNTLSALIKCG